jgi:hypothetical protein
MSGSVSVILNEICALLDTYKGRDKVSCDPEPPNPPTTPLLPDLAHIMLQHQADWRCTLQQSPRREVPPFQQTHVEH